MQGPLGRTLRSSAAASRTWPRLPNGRSLPNHAKTGTWALFTSARSGFEPNRFDVVSDAGSRNSLRMCNVVGHCTLNRESHRAEARNHAEVFHRQKAKHRSHVHSPLPCTWERVTQPGLSEENLRISRKNDLAPRMFSAPMCSPLMLARGRTQEHESAVPALKREDAEGRSQPASSSDRVQQ